MEHLDLHPRIHAALVKAKLKNIRSILTLSPSDIERLTQLSKNDVAVLQGTVAHSVSRIPMTTGLQLYLHEEDASLSVRKLSTGCPILDEFLGGGIISRGITEISGQSASGKTQLCMQLCLTIQLPLSLGGLNAGALYVCTEDVFPNKRLMQMIELLQKRLPNNVSKLHPFSNHVFIEHAAEMDDLWNCIKHKAAVLLQKGRIKLIVIDSIAALFRCEYSAKELAQRAKKLSEFGSQLFHLGTQYNIPVICVNQVSDIVKKTDGINESSNSRQVQPALGLSWANIIMTRIMLTRTEKTVPLRSNKDSMESASANIRTMEIMFAPHLPNRMCYYTIDQDGVKGLS